MTSTTVKSSAPLSFFSVMHERQHRKITVTYIASSTQRSEALISWIGKTSKATAALIALFKPTEEGEYTLEVRDSADMQSQIRKIHKRQSRTIAIDRRNVRLQSFLPITARQHPISISVVMMDGVVSLYQML